LEQVFEFFGNPENLPRIMPGWMQMHVDDATIVAAPDAPLAESLLALARS
jgi:hypothetical protein